jgi:hypothetical protein
MNKTIEYKEKNLSILDSNKKLTEKYFRKDTFICIEPKEKYDFFKIERDITVTNLLTILAIMATYLVASCIYKREKRDNKKTEAELIRLEFELFVKNLNILKEAIEKQIQNFNEYFKEENWFKLKINDKINIEFLYLISIQNIHKFLTKNKIETTINDLYSSLFLLKNYSNSITEQFRAMEKKHTFHEAQFKTYTPLLQTTFFELCKKRGIDTYQDETTIKWKNTEDHFMNYYGKLILETRDNKSIINKDGSIVSRKELIDKFVKPLGDNSYIIGDIDALYIFDKTQYIYSAFTDMEATINSTKERFKNENENLKKLHQQISQFIDKINPNSINLEPNS